MSAICDFGPDSGDIRQSGRPIITGLKYTELARKAITSHNYLTMGKFPEASLLCSLTQFLFSLHIVLLVRHALRISGPIWRRVRASPKPFTSRLTTSPSARCWPCAQPSLPPRPSHRRHLQSAPPHPHHPSQ